MRKKWKKKKCGQCKSFEKNEEYHKIVNTLNDLSNLITQRQGQLRHLNLKK